MKVRRTPMSPPSLHEKITSSPILSEKTISNKSPSNHERVVSLLLCGCIALLVLRLCLVVQERHENLTWETYSQAIALMSLGVFSFGQRTKELYTSEKLQYRAEADSGIVIGAMIIPLYFASKILNELEDAKAVVDMQKYASSCVLVIVRYKYKPFLSSSFMQGLLLLSFSSIVSLINSRFHTLVVFGPLLIFHGYLFIGLQQLQKSFTLGEGMFIAQALSLYSFDALTGTYNKIPALSSHPLPLFLQREPSELHIILQALIIGVLICGAAVLPVVHQIRDIHAKSAQDRSGKKEVANRAKILIFWTALFYAILAFMIGGLVNYWVYRMIGKDAFSWAFEFCGTPTRLGFIGYWVITLALSLSFIGPRSKLVPNIVVRKYYHGLAVLMFLPAAMYDSEFMALAFAVGFAAMMLAEYIRVGHIPPVGKDIDGFMKGFIDARDAGPLIITHLYLLVGCAVTLWSEGGILASDTLAAYAGILILGVGDAMASLIGFYFGRIKWPSTRKTVEGTLAGIISIIGFAAMISLFGRQLHRSQDTLQTTEQWIGLFAATTATCLLEAFTTQIDNAVLPVFYYAMMLIARA